MMKKSIFWIALIVVAVVLIAIGIFGKQYYDNRYVGTDYYTVVPFGYNMEPKQARSSSGEDMGSAIEYNLAAFNEAGEAKLVSFIVYNPESGFSREEEQPQPGTYLQVNASKQLVVGWSVIDEGAIPKKALEMIEENSVSNSPIP